MATNTGSDGNSTLTIQNLSENEGEGCNGVNLPYNQQESRVHKVICMLKNLWSSENSSDILHQACRCFFIRKMG